jgi:hypothetical protein
MNVIHFYGFGGNLVLRYAMLGFLILLAIPRKIGEMIIHRKGAKGAKIRRRFSISAYACNGFPGQAGE